MVLGGLKSAMGDHDNLATEDCLSVADQFAMPRRAILGALAACTSVIADPRLARAKGPQTARSDVLSPGHGGSSAQANRTKLAESLRYHSQPLGVIYDNPPDRLSYIFRNMTEFMPHGVLSRGSGPVRPFLSHPKHAKALGNRLIPTSLGEMSIDHFVHHPRSLLDGMVVANGDRIAYEAYPRMAPDERHILWSVTKPFVGLAVMLLQEAGLVNFADPIDQYIPDLQGTAWSGTSVRDILNMRSGILAPEDDAAFSKPEHPYYRFEASIGYLPHRLDDRSTYAVVASLGRGRPAGARYEYSSVNTFVLAWLVETLAQQQLYRFFADRVWQHIGAQADAVWTLSPQGAPGADGGLSLVLRDLARFGLQFAERSGRRTWQALVSASMMRQIAASGRDYPAHPTLPGDPPKLHYNSMQWDRIWPNGDMMKRGWGGQGLFVSPRRQIVIAWYGTPEGEALNEVHDLVHAIAHQVTPSPGCHPDDITAGRCAAASGEG